jgi:hypothetical protein
MPLAQLLPAENDQPPHRKQRSRGIRRRADIRLPPSDARTADATASGATVIDDFNRTTDESGPRAEGDAAFRPQVAGHRRFLAVSVPDDCAVAKFIGAACAQRVKPAPGRQLRADR